MMGVTPQRPQEAGIIRYLTGTELSPTVADVMTTDVVTVSPHQSLADAISLIAIHHFHHLVVVDLDAKIIGVVSDRDILRAGARTPDWHSYAITEVMTPNPIYRHSGNPRFCCCLNNALQ